MKRPFAIAAYWLLCMAPESTGWQRRTADDEVPWNMVKKALAELEEMKSEMLPLEAAMVTDIEEYLLNIFRSGSDVGIG